MRFPFCDEGIMCGRGNAVPVFSDELKLIISLVEGMRMLTYVTLHYRYCWIYGSELFTLEVVRSISIRLPEIESWRNKIMLQNTSRHQREVDEVIQNHR